VQQLAVAMPPLVQAMQLLKPARLRPSSEALRRLVPQASQSEREACLQRPAAALVAEPDSHVSR
jgi:hypothetical protein